GGRPGPLPHQRACAGGDARRHPLPDADRAIHGSRPHRPRATSAPDPRPDAGRPPAPGHAELPPAVDDSAARVLGRAGGTPAARPRHHRSPASPRSLPDLPTMTARERAARRQAWLMMAPALGALILLTVYPALWVLWLSLEDYVPIFEVARFV